MPLVILSLKPEDVVVTEEVDPDEGRGRIFLNLRSGEGSLEITIKFWTVKLLFLVLFDELVAF